MRGEHSGRIRQFWTWGSRHWRSRLVSPTSAMPRVGEGTPRGAVASPPLSNIYVDPLDHHMAERGYEMVRYADDVVVMCRCPQEAADGLCGSATMDDASRPDAAPNQDAAGQNTFGRPACFRTSLAVWRDLILLSTTNRFPEIGLSQISWSPRPWRTNQHLLSTRISFNSPVKPANSCGPGWHPNAHRGVRNDLDRDLDLWVAVVRVQKILNYSG